MSKQSLSAVPPNVANPEVLKRFLSRLIEELDVVLGFRGTGKDKYVSQQELTSAAETLSSLEQRLAEATARLKQVRKDTEALAIEAGSLIARTDLLASSVQSVDTFAKTQTWLKMFEVDFIGRSSDGLATTFRTFNVVSVTRTAAGKYSVTFTANTFLTTSIIGNTKVVIEFLIDPTTLSSLYSIEYAWNGTTLEISIWQHSISGTNIVRTAFDPIVGGNSIRVSGLMARPSAGVPA